MLQLSTENYAHIVPISNLKRASYTTAVQAKRGATKSVRARLVDGREPIALEQKLLRRLRAQVGVTRLLVHEHAANLAQLRIHVSDLELDRALENVELLVVLVEQPLVTASLQRRKRDRLIVASRRAAPLRIQEETGAVRGDLELARELQARVDAGGVAVSLGDQILHREEERHALATRKLHRGRRVVDAILLDEGQLAIDGLEVAVDARQHVGLASRHLRIDSLRNHARLGELVLEDLEARRLKAELVNLVCLATSQLDGGGAATLDVGARVGE